MYIVLRYCEIVLYRSEKYLEMIFRLQRSKTGLGDLDHDNTLSMILQKDSEDTLPPIFEFYLLHNRVMRGKVA